jgi:hypothetical protein
VQRQLNEHQRNIHDSPHHWLAFSILLTCYHTKSFYAQGSKGSSYGQKI